MLFTYCASFTYKVFRFVVCSHFCICKMEFSCWDIEGAEFPIDFQKGCFVIAILFLFTVCSFLGFPSILFVLVLWFLMAEFLSFNTLSCNWNDECYDSVLYLELWFFTFILKVRRMRHGKTWIRHICIVYILLKIKT